MLDQIFNKLQLSRIAMKDLQSLLWEFSEPFDEEMAMKDWNYGGKANLDRKRLIFFYKYIYNQVFDILETVFTPYIDKEKEFIEVHPVVASDYKIMLQFLYLIQNHINFMFTYKIDFRPVLNIDGDPEKNIANWSKLRGKFIDHRAKISELALFNKVTEYKIPYRLWRFDKAIRNNLSKQKEFQKNKQVIKDDKDIIFRNKTSKKKTLYLSLKEHLNTWVNKDDIKKRAKIRKDDDFRSYIHQLREDIRIQKKDNHRKIESNGKGMWKLTDLI